MLYFASLQENGVYQSIHFLTHFSVAGFLEPITQERVRIYPGHVASETQSKHKEENQSFTLYSQIRFSS